MPGMYFNLGAAETRWKSGSSLTLACAGTPPSIKSIVIRFIIISTYSKILVNVNAIAGMLEKMQRKMTVSMIFLMIFFKKMMKKKRKHNATKKPTPQMQKEKCKSP